MPKTRSRLIFIGTYPPRECGIATFNQDLLVASQKNAFEAVDHKVAAFNVSRLDNYVYPKEVEWEIDQNSKKDHFDLAKKINEDGRVSGVVLQHEYGIYGGKDGENILHFMKKCKKPILVTLHTVLPNPTNKMYEVTSEIIQHSSVLVVLTENSRKVLESVYSAAVGKIYVVPHGIPATSFTSTKIAKKRLGLEKFTVLSTFGLLSRGKGIEHVITALPKIIKKYPSVLYLILGKTHPSVRRFEGEKYRNKLIALVEKLHLKNNVKFYDQYLGIKDLIDFLKASDIYISTSTNPNQAVSGTLSYAMGAGRAVVSTQFAQALEIVTEETGRLVPIKDSKAFAKALLNLLSDKKRLRKMHRSAYEITRPMLWSNVALKYASLLKQNTLPKINPGHLRKMTDSMGLFQFAKHGNPNKKFGYTLDDNARALIVCSRFVSNGYKTRDLNKLTETYLNFIEKCILSDGTFTNYLEYKSEKPTLQNKKEDLEEASARTIWALSEIINSKSTSLVVRTRAMSMFLDTFPLALKFKHLRPIAFSIKAFSNAIKSMPIQKDLFTNYIKLSADILVKELEKNSEANWYWFQDFLGYNNAVLPEALFIAAGLVKNENYLKKATLSLEFLISHTFRENMYMPIGQSTWFKKGEKRALFDQQPEDPGSMILALATAYKITQNDVYKNLAGRAFSWFLGNNSLGLSLYDYENGGVYDGLQPTRVNQNQGAESLVSYLLARLTIAELKLSQDYENSANNKYISKSKGRQIQFGSLAKV